METKDKLSKMVSKKWLYKTSQITVENFFIKDETVQIVTDKGFFDIKLNAIDDFIGDCMPISNSEVGVFNMPNLQIANSSTMTNLRDIILKNIDTLQKDKDYIPQAQAVNEQIKSFIDLAKVEVDMVRIIRGK